ncbi:MAG: CRISPR-associated protein Csx3 [Chitinophagales bacterium]|nr:CRISPR-associated protein Csx3 [Chitinophagales bacterium]MCB9021005.1 CRISPR-associated protein Csx3 [Chitinophagales bacterium]HAE35001.1 CRISPR-associated protein Csx3 [Bacteroidota bacterium]HPE99005.1 CRISPR-associated ring nuclease Crn3/Csx3 [Chitinophagales bacterium]HQU77125.1 CRISPR-associated ring nuclease Crn3/Csx3 [Chitinophagales bacterium]
MHFELKEDEKWVVIHFEGEGIILPEELRTISPPDLVKLKLSHKGVVLSGRGPVWLYSFLTHFYHPAAFIATFDTHLNKAVVTSSHVSGFSEGDILEL